MILGPDGKPARPLEAFFENLHVEMVLKRLRGQLAFARLARQTLYGPDNRPVESTDRICVGQTVTVRTPARYR